MNTTTSKPFVDHPAAIQQKFLQPEERAKIKYALVLFDDDGLLGQFPELSSDGWSEKMQSMFEQAEVNLKELSKAKEFQRFFKQPDPLHIGWTINEVIAQAKNPPMGWRIWSINVGDNRNLGLVFTKNNKLILVNDEFHYQSEHATEFHWMLRHDGDNIGSHALEMDSHRLSTALTILADKEKAREFIRAKIHFLETFSD